MGQAFVSLVVRREERNVIPTYSICIYDIPLFPTYPSPKPQTLRPRNILTTSKFTVIVCALGALMDFSGGLGDPLIIVT